MKVQVERLFEPIAASRHGPKGCRVGDVVQAEGSRWRVEALDPAHSEAICRLLRGSHALRRFRARRIEGVEHGQKRQPKRLRQDGWQQELRG